MNKILLTLIFLLPLLLLSCSGSNNESEAKVEAKVEEEAEAKVEAKVEEEAKAKRTVDKELLNQLDYIVDTEQSFDGYTYPNFLYEWVGTFKESGDIFAILCFEGTDIDDFSKEQMTMLGLVVGQEVHFKDNLAIACPPDSKECDRLIKDLLK